MQENYQNSLKKHKSFSTLILITLIAVYLLIFIGSLVRATGSGMGCPDWPTCFGQFIPPTSVSELPLNYQEIYPAYEQIEFNAFNTWVEYFNRLSGSIIGLLMLASLIYAFRLRKIYGLTFRCLSGCFVLTLFQGWLGSVVVASFLEPVIISIHMIFAQIIALALVYAYFTTLNLDKISLGKERKFLWFSVVILLLQMSLGLMTRQNVDALTHQGLESIAILDQLDLVFELHMGFAIVVLSFVCLSVFKLLGKINTFTKTATLNLLKKNALILLVLLFITFMVGSALVRFDLPFLLQPVHLVLASINLGLLFSLLIVSKK